MRGGVALLTQKNDFLPLLKVTNFYLDFYANNFTNHLIEIIKKGKFDFVEFQCKEVDYLKNVNLSSIKQLCKIGLAIHNEIELDQSIINQMNYCLVTWRSKVLKARNGTEMPVIQNWIDSIKPIWNYSGQNKAIYIARLDDGKLPTLKSFLKTCKMIGCKYEIAGNIEPGNNTHSLITELNPNAYIGEIDTIKFLTEHANDYLFIGGVGQVVLESLSFGIPTIVCTHRDDNSLSRFVIKDNFDKLLYRNFVINKFLADYQHGNINQFINDIKVKSFYDYNCVDKLRANCSTEISMKQYTDLLNNA